MKPYRRIGALLGIMLLSLAQINAGAEEPQMSQMKKAYFAGGCFWCMEGPFEKVDGVKNVDSGYANSKTPDPDYGKVSMGITGAFEAIEVVYDPEKVNFEDLLNVYWTTIDPTQADGQFADRGSQYHTAIFYQDDEEKNIAEESKKILDESKIFRKPIAVQVVAFKNWTRAEEYHQDYHTKNSMAYTAYSIGSGRKFFLDNTWKKKPYCPLRRITPEKLKQIQEQAGKKPA